MRINIKGNEKDVKTERTEEKDQDGDEDDYYQINITKDKNNAHVIIIITIVSF